MTTETTLQAIDDVHAATALLRALDATLAPEATEARYVLQAALENLKSASWTLDA